MKLHLAVDLVALGPALELAESVCESIDSMWLGPVLLKNEGLKAVEAFKTSFCDKPVVADMRGMEAAGIEAALAFAARADGITILGISPDENIKAAVESSLRSHRQVIANIYGVTDPVQRTKVLVELGVRQVVVELAGDGTTMGLSEATVEAIVQTRISVVCKCRNLAALTLAARCGVTGALVGPPIYAAVDPIAAAQAFHAMASTL